MRAGQYPSSVREADRHTRTHSLEQQHSRGSPPDPLFTSVAAAMQLTAHRAAECSLRIFAPPVATGITSVPLSREGLG